MPLSLSLSLSLSFLYLSFLFIKIQKYKIIHASEKIFSSVCIFDLIWWIKTQLYKQLIIVFCFCFYHFVLVRFIGHSSFQTYYSVRHLHPPVQSRLQHCYDTTARSAGLSFVIPHASCWLVCMSVGPCVGRSVCHDFFLKCQGSYTSIASVGALVYLKWLKIKKNKD